MNKKIYQRPRTTLIAIDAAVMDIGIALVSGGDNAKGFSKRTGSDWDDYNDGD